MALEKSNNWLHSKAAGHLAAFVAVLCWGCSFISSKILMEGAGLTPVEVYVYRFVIAYLLVLALTFKNIRSRSWRDELQFALCGVCSGTLYFLMENYALKYTSTGNVSLLSSISPIFTALLLAFIYRMRPRPGEIWGSAVAFAGVALVIMSEPIALGLGMEFHPLGDFLSLSCAFSWAVYSIAVKRLIPLYSSIFLTRKLFFYGLLTSIPLLLMEDAPLRLGEVFSLSQPLFLINLLFLAVMCSFAAYLLWNSSMKIIGPLSTSNYIYFQAPITMIAGALILGENVYPLGYVGCLLVLGGLFIADRKKKQ